MGHQYGAASFSGNSSAVFGDVHHHHHSASGVSNVEQRKAIAEWYSRADFADQQTDHISRQEEGTGGWFLARPEYQHWRDNVNNNLLCPGIPGSGKSMIASIVVDNLQTHFAAHENVAIAYTYCNFKRQTGQTLCHMLAILTRQLFQERNELPEAVQSLYQKHRDRATRPSDNELRHVLRILVGLYERVFVVIDALDECQKTDRGRDKLLTELFSLQKQKQGNVNILATCRPIPEIMLQFSEYKEIGIRAHENDLEIYLTNRMAELPRFISQNAQLQQQIKNQIIEAADGMFLLARLQFDSLHDKLTPRKLRDALAKLARDFNGLDSAYEDALDRINHQRDGYRDTARKVLLWIIYARRELSIEELQEAIAIEPGLESLDHEEDLTNVDDIVTACQGLIEVDRESQIIRLVHHTTQEFFERIRERWLPDGDLEITRSCLALLNMAFLMRDSRDLDTGFFAMGKKFRLLKYVKLHWGAHAQSVDDVQVCTDILRFLCFPGCATFMGDLVLALWDWRLLRQYTPCSALHICALFGLKHVLQIAIKDNIDVNTRDALGKTPLHWAASYGHPEVVRLLLARSDTDVNVQDHYNGTALSYATARGEIEIVKLLLARSNINVNNRIFFQQTPFHIASHNRNIRRTPLHIALSNRKPEIFQLLIACPKVDINAPDERNKTALFYAIDMMYTEIVQLLLTRCDIDVNFQDVDGATPLSLAVSKGYAEIVQLFVARSNVSVNLARWSGWTPLHQASCEGKTELVQLLLTRPEIKVAFCDSSGRTPFSLAKLEGHKEITELLMARDVSLGSAD